MRCVDGVLETRVGYALGEKPLWNPPLKESVTYEEVCNHSGHAEAVEVVFDAEKISLTEILREYCYTIDPTSLGRQGMDIGIQYRTGIYSLTEKQRQTAQAFLDMLKQPFFKIESDYYMIKGVQGKDYFRIAVHGKHEDELQKLEEFLDSGPQKE